MTALPFLLKIAMFIFESVISKNKDKKEVHELYIKLVKAMRENGITTAVSRLEYESQIQAGNDVWDEREKQQQGDKNAPS
jgi:PBP1b-binding outer membrane lipoprotein LpoB